jgi:hypothetical protein
MTQDQIIEQAFLKGVEAQQRTSNLPAPEGTNPTLVQKLAICLPLIAFLLVPAAVHYLTDDLFIVGFALSGCIVFLFGVVYQLMKMMRRQNEAIAQRDLEYLQDACRAAKDRLTGDGSVSNRP